MTDTPAYTPPKVWTWNKDNGGRFANINRPIAGPTHDKELPVGRHPLQLYSLATPNGVKVTVMLEELLALGHTRRGVRRLADPHQRGRPVRQRLRGGQPELQDPGAAGPQRARRRCGCSSPARSCCTWPRSSAPSCRPSGAARAECLSWLFWQMGSAPYLGGGFGHFYAYAPTKIEYAIDRFAMEVKRQLDVLDRRLAESAYLAGDDYTIADMAVWPWYGALAKGLLYDAGEFLQVQEYKHVQRWTDADRRSARRCSAAAWSTAPGASRRASCTSATTPATSRRRRRTSWHRRASAGAQPPRLGYASAG